jgi:uncharacterized protein
VGVGSVTFATGRGGDGCQRRVSEALASVPIMEQRISLITLGVSDLARAKRFYEALGWRGQEVEQTVFFQAGGMAVVLWGIDQLAQDAGLPPAALRAGQDFRGMGLAQNVRSRAEVDTVIGAARSAGATVTSEPAETFYGGYAGYFVDPDGHAWEIAYNPGFSLAADGSLTLPDFGAAG